jgi:uridine kinase
MRITISGPPGSGKTTFINRYLEEQGVKDKYVVINSDDYKSNRERNLFCLNWNIVYTMKCREVALPVRIPEDDLLNG